MLWFVKLQISILNFIHILFQNDDLSSHSSEVKILLNSFAISILLIFQFEYFFFPSHSFRMSLSIKGYLNVNVTLTQFYTRLPFAQVTILFEIQIAEVWIYGVFQWNRLENTQHMMPRVISLQTLIFEDLWVKNTHLCTDLDSAFPLAPGQDSDAGAVLPGLLRICLKLYKYTVINLFFFFYFFTLEH